MYRVMMNQNDLIEILRRRLIADLHLGRLKPGGRVRSIRGVAKELGVGVRAVTRAYRTLEREGLVEVRGRSGVFAAAPHATMSDLEEPHRWYSMVLTDAWQRRIPLPQLPQLLEQFFTRKLRCACVESTEDHMVAFCAELEEDFGLSTYAVSVPELSKEAGKDRAGLLDAVAEADLIVTTAFHLAELRAAGERLNKPVIVVSVNDAIVEAIQREMSTRPLRLMVADPAFATRVSDYFAESFSRFGEMRIEVIVSDVEDRIAQDAATLYTRAAHRRVRDGKSDRAPIPFLSLDAARNITRSIIGLQQDLLLQLA